MNQRGKITLMVFFFSLCGTAALVNFYAQQRQDRIKPADLYEVVNRQLSALRGSDYPQAYQRASTGIQRKFTVAQFADMSRSEYSRITRAERVECGAVMCRRNRAIVQVFFTDDAGGVTPCFYSLIHEGEEWKIDGARLMRRWPPGRRLGGLRS